MQIDLRALRALGGVKPPTNKIFIFKPTPRSNFCLLAPAQFSKHTAPFGRVDPVGPGLGWAPTNKILHGKPTLRSNFFLLAPVQFFILQGFSDGVTIGGTPGGQHLWEPMPNFGVMACVGPAAGRRTYTHTHTFIFILQMIWNYIDMLYFEIITKL